MVGHDITKGGCSFFSPYRYRRQLYSIIYGQAIPSVIGQKSVALTDEQRKKIEETAQGILNARALYPDSSLADLYDELTMPIELRKAHQANDRAVMKAYGFPIKDFTEEDCVAELMKMYQKLVEK